MQNRSLTWRKCLSWACPVHGHRTNGPERMHFLPHICESEGNKSPSQTNAPTLTRGITASPAHNANTPSGAQVSLKNLKTMPLDLPRPNDTWNLHTPLSRAQRSEDGTLPLLVFDPPPRPPPPSTKQNPNSEGPRCSMNPLYSTPWGMPGWRPDRTLH